MSKVVTVAELQERLAIAERAIADSAARIGELAGALADVTRGSGMGDVANAKPIVIDADSVTPFCTGFYQREYDPADRPYRWTGRGGFFELRFPVDRSFEWNFAMELQRNAHVDISMLRVYVDYLEIPTHVEPMEAIVRGVIPARPFGRQAVMTFQLPGLFVPNQINPESTDARTLGVVFYDLRANPRLDGGDLTESRSVSAELGGFLRKARGSLTSSVARAKSR